MQLALARSQELATSLVAPEAAIRHKGRLALGATALLVISFAAAGFILPVDGAVIAHGQVSAASGLKRVAHPTGGVIAEIYVRSGDRVAKGQPLIRFDDVVSSSDAMTSSRSVVQLLAQKARLEAELSGGTLSFPEELIARTDAEAASAMREESQLFAVHRQQQQGAQAQLRARISGFAQEIAGYRAQIAAIGHQKALIEPERHALGTLFGKGLVTLSRRNQMERQAVDLDSSAAQLAAEIAVARAKATEAGAELAQVGDAQRADAGNQLISIQAALLQQRHRTVEASDAQSRSLVRAPYAGTVDKVASSAVGDVVRPGDGLMEIVPDDTSQIVEVQVAPADIDRTQRGAAARIRFSAFNAPSTPEIWGKVVKVAPNVTVDREAKSSFYTVQVAIDPASLAKLGALKLTQGMPAEVLIASGRRSLLSYLTKPLQDQFARAFRDE